jgi:hypothetical protein
LRGDSSAVVIAPRSPDRSVVSRPESPFHVLRDEETVLFVGCPLWVSATTEDPPHTIVDVPAVRPSDTWFGPTTKDGELCYANRTYCLLRFEDVQPKPHRGITAVTIRNRSDGDLVLERIKLPVDALSLYGGDDGRIWTQDVTLESREAGDFAHINISKDEPRFAAEPQLLAAARAKRDENVVVRAFSTLFDR